MTKNFLAEKTARITCESLLVSERNYRIEQDILPSEVKIIDRLLKRGVELNDAYEEIFGKLKDHEYALKVFLEIVANTAAFWSPAANAKARRAREELVEVNEQIQEKALEISELLAKRTHLNNHSGFSSGTYNHPIDVLHAAAGKNHLYQQWVKEEIEPLTGRFDLKYWPSLSEFMLALAQDAEGATPHAHDALTDVGTEGSRASMVGTFKAFFVGLEESKKSNHGFLPDDLELSDRSVASIMSCALDLSADEVVDSGYVKRLRQRQREKFSET